MCRLLIDMNIARSLRPILLRSNTKSLCSATVVASLYPKTPPSPFVYFPSPFSAQFSTMPSNEGPNTVQADPKVLVIGGSYSGLAATVNLIDLCNGKQPRFTSTSNEVVSSKTKLPIDITIVDERDGYCMYQDRHIRYDVLILSQTT